jgi:type II secretory pathway pseudopilin PulG
MNFRASAWVHSLVTRMASSICADSGAPSRGLPANRNRRAATLIQLLVVISIMATLAVLLFPTFGGVRQKLFETECRDQLAAVDLAMGKYAHDHRGQLPPTLGTLVPDYVSEDQLICPMVRNRSPEGVARAKALRARNPRIRYWYSYFYFEQKGLDHLFSKGTIPIGYSAVLQQRKEETPVLACLDHREPVSLRYASQTTPAMLKSWYFPDRPVLVLRRSHRVDSSHYGGLYVDGQEADTLAQLMHL